MAISPARSRERRAATSLRCSSTSWVLALTGVHTPGERVAMIPTRAPFRERVCGARGLCEKSLLRVGP